MPLYVYSCKARHRYLVVHGMNEAVEIHCGECAEQMQRVPQTFRWGRNAGQVLLDYMEERWRESKARAIKRKQLSGGTTNG